MHLLTSLVRSGLVCAAGSADSTCSSLQPWLISQHRRRFGRFSQFPWSVAKSRVDNSVEGEGLQENTVYIDKARGQGCALAFVMWLPEAESDPELKCFLSPLPLLHILTKSLSRVCPGVGCGTAEATTGKTKGAVSHYVPPGFLPLEGKCFASVHRLGLLGRGPVSQRAVVAPRWPKSQGFPVCLLRGMVNGLEVQRAYTPISPRNAEGYFEVLIKVSKPGQYGLEKKVFSLGTKHAISASIETLSNPSWTVSLWFWSICDLLIKTAVFPTKLKAEELDIQKSALQQKPWDHLGEPLRWKGVSIPLLSFYFAFSGCLKSQLLSAQLNHWFWEMFAVILPSVLYLKNSPVSVGSCSWCADSLRGTLWPTGQRGVP